MILCCYFLVGWSMVARRFCAATVLRMDVRRVRACGVVHDANLSDRINSRHALPDKYINLP
jgi:hypothetical protein